MRRSVSILLGVAGLITLLFASSSSTRAAQAPNTYLQDTVPLSILWRVNVAGHDYMTNVSSATTRQYCVNQTYGPCNAVFYIPRDTATGTAPMYRAFNSSIPDHMDQNTASVCCGYVLENNGNPVAYPWSSSTATPGLLDLEEVLKGSDHAIQSSLFPLGSGWVLYGNLNGLWGYPRYNATNESLLSLPVTNGTTTLTIASNKVTGGALWQWTVATVGQTTTEYVNDWDYGRQIQSALFYDDQEPPTSAQNPTEAGDIYALNSDCVAQGGHPELCHGSPLISASNNGTTQSTRAIPLEYAAYAYGGSDSNPVLHKSMVIGKDIQLNYNGMNEVAKYTTWLTVPQSIPYSVLQIPEASLTGIFTRFYTYDATSGSLSEKFPICSTTVLPVYQMNYGGAIVSDADQTHAFGIYGRGNAVGGSVTAFQFLNHTKQQGTESCPSGGTGQYDDRSSTVWASYGYLGSSAGRVTIPAGDSIYFSWLISGSLSSVESSMHSLYLQGVGLMVKGSQTRLNLPVGFSNLIPTSGR